MIFENKYVSVPTNSLNFNCRDGSAVALDGLRVSRARLGDLTILAVELSDEGNYTCRASNVYAEIETVSRVEVIKKSGGGEGARDVDSLRFVNTVAAMY